MLTCFPIWQILSLSIWCPPFGFPKSPPSSRNAKKWLTARFIITRCQLSFSIFTTNTGVPWHARGASRFFFFLCVYTWAGNSMSFHPWLPWIDHCTAQRRPLCDLCFSWLKRTSSILRMVCYWSHVGTRIQRLWLQWRRPAPTESILKLNNETRSTSETCLHYLDWDKKQKGPTIRSWINLITFKLVCLFLSFSQI